MNKFETHQRAISNSGDTLFGVVVLFDVWRSETTDERKLEEIGRSPKLEAFTALNVYAETPNPASQLLYFRNDKEYEEVSAELNEAVTDPEWLYGLFQQI